MPPNNDIQGMRDPNDAKTNPKPGDWLCGEKESHRVTKILNSGRIKTQVGIRLSPTSHFYMEYGNGLTGKLTPDQWKAFASKAEVRHAAE